MPTGVACTGRANRWLDARAADGRCAALGAAQLRRKGSLLAAHQPCRRGIPCLTARDGSGTAHGLRKRVRTRTCTGDALPECRFSVCARVRVFACACVHVCAVLSLCACVSELLSCMRVHIPILHVSPPFPFPRATRLHNSVSDCATPRETRAADDQLQCFVPRAVCAGYAHAAGLHAIDWPREDQGLQPLHICAGTGLALATSAPGLGSPLPHLHRD